MAEMWIPLIRAALFDQLKYNGRYACPEANCSIIYGPEPARFQNGTLSTTEYQADASLWKGETFFDAGTFCLPSEYPEALLEAYTVEYDMETGIHDVFLSLRGILGLSSLLTPTKSSYVTEFSQGAIKAVSKNGAISATSRSYSKQQAASTLREADSSIRRLRLSKLTETYEDLRDESLSMPRDDAIIAVGRIVCRAEGTFFDKHERFGTKHDEANSVSILDQILSNFAKDREDDEGLGAISPTDDIDTSTRVELACAHKKSRKGHNRKRPNALCINTDLGLDYETAPTTPDRSRSSSGTSDNTSSTVGTSVTSPTLLLPRGSTKLYVPETKDAGIFSALDLHQSESVSFNGDCLYSPWLDLEISNQQYDAWAIVQDRVGLENDAYDHQSLLEETIVSEMPEIRSLESIDRKIINSLPCFDVDKFNLSHRCEALDLLYHNNVRPSDAYIRGLDLAPPSKLKQNLEHQRANSMEAAGQIVLDKLSGELYMLSAPVFPDDDGAPTDSNDEPAVVPPEVPKLPYSVPSTPFYAHTESTPLGFDHHIPTVMILEINAEFSKIWYDTPGKTWTAGVDEAEVLEIATGWVAEEWDEGLTDIIDMVNSYNRTAARLWEEGVPLGACTYWTGGVLVQKVAEFNVKWDFFMSSLGDSKYALQCRDPLQPSLASEWYLEVLGGDSQYRHHRRMETEEEGDDTISSNDKKPSEQHHGNFLGEWFHEKSNTPPAVSLFAVVTAGRSQPADNPFTRKAVLKSQATKRIDPFIFDGEIDKIDGNLKGSDLRNFAVGRTSIAYGSFGTWLSDTYDIDEDVPEKFSDGPFEGIGSYDAHGLPKQYPGLQRPCIVQPEDGKMSNVSDSGSSYRNLSGPLISKTDWTEYIPRNPSKLKSVHLNDEQNNDSVFEESALDSMQATSEDEHITSSEPGGVSSEAGTELEEDLESERDDVRTLESSSLDDQGVGIEVLEESSTLSIMADSKTIMDRIRANPPISLAIDDTLLSENIVIDEDMNASQGSLSLESSGLMPVEDSGSVEYYDRCEDDEGFEFRSVFPSPNSIHEAISPLRDGQCFNPGTRQAPEEVDWSNLSLDREFWEREEDGAFVSPNKLKETLKLEMGAAVTDAAALAVEDTSDSSEGPPIQTKYHHSQENSSHAFTICHHTVVDMPSTGVFQQPSPRKVVIMPTDHVFPDQTPPEEFLTEEDLVREELSRPYHKYNDLAEIPHRWSHLPAGLGHATFKVGRWFIENIFQ